MQEIHSMGGGGRMFATNTGGISTSGGIDRRLRAHNLQSQALKCPRCDSLNTKFCYYNNYNLSQPRHFCKSCRRYWTKGGVLRNVPVGGGCRKSTKRSASSKPKTPRKDDEEKGQEKGKSSNSNESSDSSSLTTTKTAATDGVSSSQNNIFNFPDSKFLFSSTSTRFDNQFDGPMFPEMGSFTSLMNDHHPMGGGIDITTSALHNQENLQFQPSNSTTQWQQFHKEDNLNMTSSVPGYLDHQAVRQIELQNSSQSNGGFTPFDWQQGGGNVDNQGFFDLSSTAVDPAYWNQNQWSDTNDHHNLFLP